MADDLATAFALILVIEGAIYALFPDAMKRMLARVLSLPEGSLRLAGLISAVAGVAIVWFIRR